MDGVRIVVTAVQETLIEAGTAVDPPATVATAAMAVRNPLAGRGRVDDLAELEILGERRRRCWWSGPWPRSLRSGCHRRTSAGTARARSSASTATVSTPRPSCTRGSGRPSGRPSAAARTSFPAPRRLPGPAPSITMPIGNRDDRWVFDDMDAVDVAIPDAPRPDEIVIALALSAGGRPNARVRTPA